VVNSLSFVAGTVAVSVIAFAAACSSAPADPSDPEVRSPGLERESSELPEGWEYSPPSSFERLVSEFTPGGSNIVWSSAALESLTRILDQPDGTAVRAAVLLAHSDADRATRILMERLEQRVPSVSRSLDAGDLVAAAALAQRGADLDVPARLEALASGPRPHPGLEVRVECARSALIAGRDAVVPFLVRVLRAGTPAEAQDPGDWERVETLFWAKSRAARALSDRAGVDLAFRPDGSYAHQIEEAARLERLLTD
jgi:hypothetical protein